jgi:hypothetical protein
MRVVLYHIRTLPAFAAAACICLRPHSCTSSIVLCRTILAHTPSTPVPCITPPIPLGTPPFTTLILSGMYSIALCCDGVLQPPLLQAYTLNTSAVPGSRFGHRKCLTVSGKLIGDTAVHAELLRSVPVVL